MCPNLLFLASSKRLKDLIRVKLSLRIIKKRYTMENLGEWRYISTLLHPVLDDSE
jgi:hypothetical protein